MSKQPATAGGTGDHIETSAGGVRLSLLSMGRNVASRDPGDHDSWPSDHDARLLQGLEPPLRGDLHGPVAGPTTLLAGGSTVPELPLDPAALRSRHVRLFHAMLPPVWMWLWLPAYVAAGVVLLAVMSRVLPDERPDDDPRWSLGLLVLFWPLWAFIGIGWLVVATIGFFAEFATRPRRS